MWDSSDAYFTLSLTFSFHRIVTFSISLILPLQLNLRIYQLYWWEPILNYIWITNLKCTLHSYWIFFTFVLKKLVKEKWNTERLIACLNYSFCWHICSVRIILPWVFKIVFVSPELINTLIVGNIACLFLLPISTLSQTTLSTIYTYVMCSRDTYWNEFQTIGVSFL